LQAAYRCNTLGLPHRCPLENTDKIDKSVLYTYMKNFHTPDRMVLAGVGMDHDYLVNIAKEHFVENTTPIWLEQQHLINTKMAKDDSLAQYTGGKILVRFLFP
jgi:processing peptidase subunit alpha